MLTRQELYFIFIFFVCLFIGIFVNSGAPSVPPDCKSKNGPCTSILIFDTQKASFRLISAPKWLLDQANLKASLPPIAKTLLLFGFATLEDKKSWWDDVILHQWQICDVKAKLFSEKTLYNIVLWRSLRLEFDYGFKVKKNGFHFFNILCNRHYYQRQATYPLRGKGIAPYSPVIFQE